MNFRNIALVAALVSVAGVNAQAFELRAGAGATLNGTTFVVAPGAQFDVQVWYVNGANPIDGVTQIGLALAYNSTTGTGTSAVPNAGGKLTGVSGTWNTSLLNAVGSIAKRGGNVAGGNVSASFLGAGDTRSYIFQGARSSGTSFATGFAANQQVHLATYTFTNSLANGDIWGDENGEMGILLAATTAGSNSVTTGNSGIAGVAPPGSDITGPVNFGGAPGQMGTSRYAVQAVPEPGTMAALGLGLAAIARRRRNKK